MRRILSILAVLTVGLFATSAHADTFTVDFHTASYTYTGEMVLTTTFVSSGVYYITGLSGDINGSPLTLVTPTSGNPGDTFTDPVTGYTYNNLFYTHQADPFDNIGGLLLRGLGFTFNFYDPYTIDVVLGTQSQGQENVVYDSIVGATPEPSSLILLGTGSLAMLGAVRRRIKTV